MTLLAEVGVRAPNSVILIGDSKAEPPASMHGQVVASAGSSLAIGTRSEADGQTRIRLAAPPDDPEKRPKILSFDGLLAVPTRRLEVSDVLGEVYSRHQVDREHVRVRVWLDDSSEPNDIYVLIG